MARGILGDWEAAKGCFWKVFPHEYAAALRQQVRGLVALTLKRRIVPARIAVATSRLRGCRLHVAPASIIAGRYLSLQVLIVAGNVRPSVRAIVLVQATRPAHSISFLISAASHSGGAIENRRTIVLDRTL